VPNSRWGVPHSVFAFPFVLSPFGLFAPLLGEAASICLPALVTFFFLFSAEGWSRQRYFVSVSFSCLLALELSITFVSMLILRFSSTYRQVLAVRRIGSRVTFTGDLFPEFRPSSVISRRGGESELLLPPFFGHVSLYTYYSIFPSLVVEATVIGPPSCRPFLLWRQKVPLFHRTVFPTLIPDHWSTYAVRPPSESPSILAHDT